MSTNRLETFSDGVIAIIITIMVLEFKLPEGHEFSDLQPLLPILASYALSFIFLANYWNNHHHLLQAAKGVNVKIMWANTHLLFWLSLTPFATAWMGHYPSYPIPVATYGFLQLGCGLAFLLLSRALLTEEDERSILTSIIGTSAKEKLSFVLYTIAILLSFVYTWLAFAAFLIVAIIWLIPDRRFAKAVHDNAH